MQPLRTARDTDRTRASGLDHFRGRKPNTSSYRHTTEENIAMPEGAVKNAGYLKKGGLVIDDEYMVMTGKTNREEKHTYRNLVENFFQN